MASRRDSQIEPGAKSLAKGVFFLNKYFDNSLPTRTGADHDESLLVEPLKERGVQFDTYKNKTAAEIRSIIKELVDENVEQHSAFVFAISTHCENNCLHGRDGVDPLNISTDILQPFGNCGKLKNKPKIFLLQGCQEVPVGDKSEPFTRKKFLSRLSWASAKTADMCIAVPQPSEFSSRRSPLMGSVLLRIFHYVLRIHGDDYNIEQLLMKANRIAQGLPKKQRKGKSLPLYECSLRKPFFFDQIGNTIISKMDKIIGDVDIYMAHELGRGSFSVVYRGTTGNRDTKEFVAAKNITAQMSSESIMKAAKDFDDMKEFESEFLVSLLQHSVDLHNTLWIFLEFCEFGDLNKFFEKHDPGESIKMNFMIDIASGLKYLHGKDMVHGNIKPENILVKPGWKRDIYTAKIADSGFSKLYHDESEENSSPYTASEQFHNKTNLDKGVDIFSTGLVFLAMISFKRGENKLNPAYEKTHVHSLGESMANKDKEKASKLPEKWIAVKGDDIERMIRRLILKMVASDLQKRWSAVYVLDMVENLPLDSLVLKLFNTMQEGQKRDSMNSVEAVLRADGIIDAVGTDAVQVKCATVTRESWKTNSLVVTLWTLLNNQSWEKRSLAVSLDFEPACATVIAVLKDMPLLLRLTLDEMDRSKKQFISVDSSSGHILSKSEVHSCDLDPDYCSDKSQLLVPSSTSIIQLNAETLEVLNTWKDDRVQQPWIICSNQTRAAIRDMGKSICVFKWEDKNLSHEMIYSVEYQYCRGMQLAPDNKLVALNMYDEWSVWDESGAPLHTAVEHPTLVPGMKVGWRVFQHPVLQVYRILQDGSYIIVFYDMTCLMERLKTGDTSQLEKFLINPVISPRDAILQIDATSDDDVDRLNIRDTSEFDESAINPATSDDDVDRLNSKDTSQFDESVINPVTSDDDVLDLK